MDATMIQMLVQGQFSLIATMRSNEAATRDAISGDGLNNLLTSLFPGVDYAMLAANANVPNHLQQGVNRYVRALVRGGLNWEWEGVGDKPEQGTPAALLASAQDLVQSLAVDALVSGKIALFPWMNDAGQVSLSVLSGFLWPLYEPGSTVVVGLLQISSYFAGGRTLYEVRRFTDGLLEVFRDLTDWRAYATQPSTRFEQPHARGRLPVVFRIISRDANRQPEGLAGAAMPAFLNYLQDAVLLKFITIRGGFEERVVNSDKLLELALKDPKHPLLQDMRTVGPNKVRLGASNDRYTRLDPVKLAEYVEKERNSRSDLLDALNIPDVSGRNISGDALVERREAYTEAADALASAGADALTEACGLAAAIGGSGIVPGWRVTLKPKFSRDTAAERVAIREDVKAGVLPRSAALSGLQSLGVPYVTEEMVQEAQEAELLDRTPDGLIPGTHQGRAQEAAQDDGTGA